MTQENHYTATFSVAQPPEAVFQAITNPRGWWSQAIEGTTDKLDAEFDYHYQDVHRAKFRITELVPGKKVVWHVVDNYFNFVKDKREWTGTDVVFEIARRNDETEVRFTHLGLVSAYECYDVCSNAWGGYIAGSLRDLITTGKGRPNPIDDVVAQAHEMSRKAFTTSIIVDQSPEQVFEAVTNVRAWWSEEIEGPTDELGAEFEFHDKELHRSTQKVTELIPGKRVAWHVTSSQLDFVGTPSEWNGTGVIFDITSNGDKTELRFTHIGLVPELECYGDCSGAWGYYINDSLFCLLTTGVGKPNRKGE
jgi:uncharacterized protein YndB with AHSA1/START domain